jgi:hypothetical protein
MLRIPASKLQLLDPQLLRGDSLLAGGDVLFHLGELRLFLTQTEHGPGKIRCCVAA